MGRTCSGGFQSLLQAGNNLPLGTLDGAIVIADEESMADFGALQDRLALSIPSWRE
jgi:ATP-dependent DNA ligase